MSLTEREYHQAREAGAAKRRNGGRIGECPYRGKTPRVVQQAEAWRSGFMTEHEARQAAARKAAE